MSLLVAELLVGDAVDAETELLLALLLELLAPLDAAHRVAALGALVAITLIVATHQHEVVGAQAVDAVGVHRLVLDRALARSVRVDALDVPIVGVSELGVLLGVHRERDALLGLKDAKEAPVGHLERLLVEEARALLRVHTFGELVFAHAPDLHVLRREAIDAREDGLAKLRVWLGRGDIRYGLFLLLLGFLAGILGGCLLLFLGVASQTERRAPEGREADEREREQRYILCVLSH